MIHQVPGRAKPFTLRKTGLDRQTPFSFSYFTEVDTKEHMLFLVPSLKQCCIEKTETNNKYDKTEESLEVNHDTGFA
jgi:hypothetical protein